MSARSSSSVFAVIGLILLGSIAGDKFLGFLAARRVQAAAQTGANPPRGGWQTHSFPRIGMAIDVPSEPQDMDATLSSNLHATHIERYQGETPALRYELGRCLLTGRVPFNADAHFEQAIQDIKTAEGV